MSVQGIDVSKWQPTTPSLTGLSFLIARASIGTVIDPTYSMHIANARKAGLVVGAYHFGDNRTTAAEQARVFLKAAGDVDYYFLDHEGANQMSTAQAKAFIAAVRAAKGKCGLYHSLSGFPDLGQDFNWIALWAGSPPRIPWLFWQYQGSPLDSNVFNGTLEQLRGQQVEMGIFVRRDTPGTFTIPAGQVVRGWVPDGDGWRVVKQWPASTQPSSARYDYSLSRLSGTASPSSLIHVSEGYFATMFVATSEVDEVADKPAAPDCTAAVDEATAPLKATIDSLKQTVAGEPKRIIDAIAADRLRATIKVVYP